MNILQTICFTD